MIHVKNVQKNFKLYDKPSDRLKEIFLRRPFHRTHRALDGISFEVRPGETVGILGKNGAGKSTLLKMLTGVMIADAGHIVHTGRTTGLLELGTGFDKNLSGASNIVSNGLLIGMTQAEIKQKRQAIIEFSELGKYIDEPIRTYSSGMVMRLAFAIAIHADPECFVIDEALSVGDAHFQQKCFKRIREFRKNGGSIVFVSHDLNSVMMICDRAIVLDKGKIVFDGQTEMAINQYNKIIADMQIDENQINMQGRSTLSYGTGEITVHGAELTGLDSERSILACGEKAKLSVTLHCKTPVPPPTIGFMIRDRFGQDIFGTNTEHLNKSISLLANQVAQLSFTFPMNLAPGKYTITLAVHSDQNHLNDCYHWCDNLISFEVAGSKVPLFSGVCHLPTQVSELSVK